MEIRRLTSSYECETNLFQLCLERPALDSIVNAIRKAHMFNLNITLVKHGVVYILYAGQISKLCAALLQWYLQNLKHQHLSQTLQESPEEQLTWESGAVYEVLK